MRQDVAFEPEVQVAVERPSNTVPGDPRVGRHVERHDHASVRISGQHADHLLNQIRAQSVGYHEMLTSTQGATW